MSASTDAVIELVIDTNIALDLLVFDDPAAQPLQAALCAGRARWLATPPMRDELSRVLDYPPIVRQLRQRGLSAAAALARFDQWTSLRAPAAAAPVVCADVDDQPFIDLAVAHRALLLSKDRAVLDLKKPLARLGAHTVSVFTANMPNIGVDTAAPTIELIAKSQALMADRVLGGSAGQDGQVQNRLRSP